MPVMARNQRLADAIRTSGRRVDEFADVIGVDRKTVERWVSTGRVPRAVYRDRAEQTLSVPARFLWPGTPGPTHGIGELAGAYATRNELAPATVASLLDAATENVDVLAFSAMWLWDTVPRFTERLMAKDRAGVQVRICLGDPASDAVRLRGEEEGIDDYMQARCRLAISYAGSLLEQAPETIRISGNTLYSSIFRFDDELLVNTHLFGTPAASSPVLHLRSSGDGPIAVNVLNSFERVWGQARPVSAA
jgi:hypothetical protein